MMPTVSDRFWSMQSTFWAANPKAQRKADKLYLKDRPGQRIWAYLNDGSQWVAKPIGGGRAQAVRIDPKLHRDMIKLIGDLAPMLTNSFDRHFGQLAIDAFIGWPKMTGLSKSMLELRYFTTNEATKFHAVIVPRAPYSIYIKGRPFWNLIEANAITTTKAIAETVGLEFRRHE